MMPLKTHGDFSSSVKAEKHDPYIFLPTLSEVIGGRLRLRYSTVSDTYYRDYEDTIDPKSSNTKTNWESVLYDCKGIKKYRDEIHDELYLERDERHDIAHMVWKFDFTSSGLVVDIIQTKVEVIKKPNGRVSISMSNEEDEKIEEELEEEVNCIRTCEFSGSTTIKIKLALSTSERGKFTKLFLQSTAGKKMDCPLDINIRLKRPAFVMGRSLLLLGLMYSNEKLSENQSKSKQKRQQGDKAKKGYLYVHVHQAKRLPMRNVGMTPDPQIKCKLTIDTKGPSCKTARIRKTTNPVWDEQFMFEGIMEESFSNAKLQLQVTHDVRAFNRCKKREVLGAVSIQHLSFCDSGSDDEDPTNSVPMNGSKKLVSRDSVEMTCSRLSGANRYLQKLTYDEDIIDIMLNGSSPDLASNSFGDEANENKLNNKHRSVSLTSLQSMAKGSINDIDVDEQESWWRQARRKSFGKILNIGANKVDRDTGNLKRPSIVLSNSQESVVVFDCDEAMPNDCGAVSDNSEPYPKTQFLNFDLINDSRRTTLTPLVDSTTQTFVEPLTQIQDITRLAATHWSQLPIYKERWLYCWHPLSFLDTF